MQIGFTPCSRVIFVKSPSLFGWLNISSPNMAFWIHKIIIVTPQKDSSSPSPGQTANFPGTVVASPKKTGHQEGHSNVINIINNFPALGCPWHTLNYWTFTNIPLKINTNSTWKIDAWTTILSCWDGICSGAMVNFRWVYYLYTLSRGTWYATNPQDHSYTVAKEYPSSRLGWKWRLYVTVPLGPFSWQASMQRHRKFWNCLK